MIAVDTNIVVRFLVKDDPKQSTAAKAIFSGGAIWIAKTVLLETAWVVGKVYGYPEDAVRAALLGVIGMKNVHIEGKPGLAVALGMSGVGIEDAIHLSSRPDGASFVTFDQTFVKRAKRAGVRDIFSG